MSMQDKPEGIAGATASAATNAESIGEAIGATGTESLQENNQGGDGNNSDENPPNDDIATSPAKLGDDNDDDDDDGDAGVIDAGIAEAMGTSMSEPPAGEQQQQQQYPTGDEDGMFAGSAGEDESGDNHSDTMNDGDNDEEANKVACRPVGMAGESSPMDSMGITTTPTHRRTESDASNSNSNRKKRLCRFPGCTRVIKSQGHCQRHGAKAKRCKVEGCEKQAQGTHNGMCKRHWRAVHFPEQVAATAEAERKKEQEDQAPPPTGESVYDTVLPASIAYRPSFASHQHQQAQLEKVAASAAAAKNGTDSEANGPPSPPIPPPSIVSAMPLVTFLCDGALHKDAGWHRQAERRARGIFPCVSLSSQLEPWEKQLAMVEILLLSGGTPHANFRHLAHAWGREQGFHQVLVSSVCTRRGEVERKKRSDAGKKRKQQQQQGTSGGGNGSVGPTAAQGAAPALAPPPPAATTVAVLPIQQQQQQQQPMYHPTQNYQTAVVPWQQQAQHHAQQLAQHQQAQPQHPEIQPMTSTVMHSDSSNGVGVVDATGNQPDYH